MGEKWPVISTESCDFHAYTFGFSGKYATWDKRLYFPSEGRRAVDFFALKNPTALAGFEPANLGTKGQHATSRPPKPLLVPVTSLDIARDAQNCVFWSECNSSVAAVRFRKFGVM